MRLAGIVQDSIVDGPGLRFTVFCQGCRHACPGCHNPQTHDPSGGKEISVEELIAQIHSNPLTDGLTLSGGEPFEQPEDCLTLAKAAHNLGLTVWCYTGDTFEFLRDCGAAAQAALLREVDVLVDGPFVLSERTLSLPWRGSGNQRLVDVQKSLQTGKSILFE